MNLNIEYGHIYADESVGEEQKQSAARVLEVVGASNAAGNTHTLVVMIDEYHPKVNSLVLTGYIDYLEDLGVRPDYIVMESDLKRAAYQLLYSIPVKERKSLCKWISRKDAFPCSILTAAWYLVRLGVFSRPATAIALSERFFIGNEIVTVLPDRYRENEERALELIQASPWASETTKMHFEWT